MAVRRCSLMVLSASACALYLVGNSLWGTDEPAAQTVAAKPPQERSNPADDREEDGLKRPFPYQEDEIIQEFPVGEKMRTAWKIRYIGVNPGPGLVITGAWLKTAPEAPWFKVVETIRLSEIFVPYNDGTRIYDITGQGSYSLLTHTQADAGVNGKLRNLVKKADAKKVEGLVVHELRDTGILWKYYDEVRRGQEVVIWSTLAAANYNYLIEYSFRGDGTIGCRLGSTGKNLDNHETIGHMHHGCWRIDLDLDNGNDNSVFVVKRAEPKPGKAEDIVEPFNNGFEGGIRWKAEEFTRLRIDSGKLNGQRKKMSYELAPLRPGTPRHLGEGEGFTLHDFWVTPYQWNEQQYTNLPKFVKQGRRIEKTNVVLWYMSPAYHLPRDEDGLFVNPKGRVQVRGVAMTTWCGFELRPRNVFEKSPLYP